MMTEPLVVSARTQCQEAFHVDHQLAMSIAGLCSENASEACGVLVTWHGPWSYTVEFCQQIPPGVIYECLA